jgi:hypothetical protein
MDLLKKFQRKQIYSQQKKGILIGLEAAGRISEPSAIKNFIRIGSFFKFLPFQWNFVTGKVEAVPEKTKTFVHLNLL